MKRAILLLIACVAMLAQSSRPPQIPMYVWQTPAEARFSYPVPGYQWPSPGPGLALSSDGKTLGTTAAGKTCTPDPVEPTLQVLLNDGSCLPIVILMPDGSQVRATTNAVINKSGLGPSVQQ